MRSAMETDRHLSHGETLLARIQYELSSTEAQFDMDVRELLTRIDQIRPDFNERIGQGTPAEDIVPAEPAEQILKAAHIMGDVLSEIPDGKRDPSYTIIGLHTYFDAADFSPRVAVALIKNMLTEEFGERISRSNALEPSESYPFYLHAPRALVLGFHMGGATVFSEPLHDPSLPPPPDLAKTGTFTYRHPLTESIAIQVAPFVNAYPPTQPVSPDMRHGHYILNLVIGTSAATPAGQ